MTVTSDRPEITEDLTLGLEVHDVDAHVLEPPDLWTSRMASKGNSRELHLRRAAGERIAARLRCGQPGDQLRRLSCRCHRDGHRGRRLAMRTFFPGFLSWATSPNRRRRRVGAARLRDDRRPAFCAHRRQTAQGKWLRAPGPNQRCLGNVSR
jgi:hypothetical protein